MSDGGNPATGRPLTAVRILVGRAKHQAGSLSVELRKLGAEVLEIPFIEIRKPRSFKALDSALRNLHRYDWLILTSVNGVEAMWDRAGKLRLGSALETAAHVQARAKNSEGHYFNRAQTTKSDRALAADARLRVAAIGPATKKAIEQRGLKVDIVPKEYVAESVVRSLKRKVKGKRVLLVRAKVARDVIPRELRKAGAHVDVVEAYETVVPLTSRTRLQVALRNPAKRPHVITFTSSSTVRNFVQLLGKKKVQLAGILTASIGPVTSGTLEEHKLPVDIAAKDFTIPGLIAAIVKAFESAPMDS
jgi:uroporphyrinogen-III synthase